MQESRSPAKQLGLTVAAIGIVFGDIGTSPLYALRESFLAGSGPNPQPSAVIGVVSLLFWTLSLIVCVKYLAFVLRADNEGEGGILALVSLISRYLPARASGRVGLATVLGIVGAALLYSDGMLTPAVSVLSAIEGLTVVSPGFQRWVLPLSLVVLVALFSVPVPRHEQDRPRVRSSTRRLVRRHRRSRPPFGYRVPGDSRRAQPARRRFVPRRERYDEFHRHGIRIPCHDGRRGSVLGPRSLRPQADPPRLVFSVYPALLLNYAGQGAFLLVHPGECENLFYRLAPDWAVIPLVILATVASIIASQAVLPALFRSRARVRFSGCGRASRYAIRRTRRLASIRARHQLVPHGGHDRPRADVQVFEQACRSVRNRRVGNDGDYDLPHDLPCEKVG
jgi:KUP system potassium uptake protein